MTRLASYHRRRLLPQRGEYETRYKRKFGRVPDLTAPQTLSEKLAWMRLHDRNPLYTQLADKVAVRDYVRDRVGDEVLIPLYGVWDKPSQIPFDSLPQAFMLKCNHESGFVIACHDSSQLDRRFVCAQLATRLRMNYFYRNLEWPYRDIRPRIMAEELLQGDDGGEPVNYKFFCFGGCPEFVSAITDLRSDMRISYYSTDWDLLPFRNAARPPADDLPRPHQLPLMVEVAAALSRGLPFCRVDLYQVEERVLFGEVTVIPAAGMVMLSPSHYDRYWGDRLILPRPVVTDERQ